MAVLPPRGRPISKRRHGNGGDDLVNRIASLLRDDALMISHAHKCIFVHQRKCAGSSIITAFGVKRDSEAWNFANDGVLSPEWSRNKNTVDRYFKFAVVRNPWDRFISGWKYLPATRDRPLLDVLKNLPADGHDYRHLTRPQYLTLYDDDNDLVVDQLLRYENLAADFRSVCEKIGLETRLPRVNARPHASRLIMGIQAACGKVGARSLASRLGPPKRESYRALFDDECRALFERKFAEDIARFGYEF